MDCFSKLPPELRIRIFSQFTSTSTIFRLVQASPIMLSQYRASKTTIRRQYVVNLLAGDRHEDLLQDALGLLHLELSDKRPDNHVLKYIIMQWNAKSLPNPFEEKDQATIAKLYKLFSSMSMFVEDYISKATSSNPPQAYLCLPQIDDPNKGLYYKELSFSPRQVTLDDLTSSECHSLIRAFIRYDMFCKIHAPKVALLTDDNEYSAISKKAFEELTNCECEALSCVFDYVIDVYGALFAASTRYSTRHASSTLQDTPANPARLLYPDNLYFDPKLAYDAMKLPSERFRGYILSVLVFDLLGDLVRFANKAQPEDMRSWFYTIISHWSKSGDKLLHYYRFPFLYRFLGNRFLENPVSRRDGSLRSLLVQRLLSADRIWDSGQCHVLSWCRQKIMFRQRAWVFLDDTRLLQKGLDHFPAIEDLEKHSTAERTLFHAEKRQRLRRLQLCHYRREAGIGDTQNEGREYIFKPNNEDSIPRFFDQSGTRNVTTFWQHI
ncbi:hypothetical protein FPCIR_357 [Fusarium pseudocircinatum]|uniref:Uncharacterized protein n=1 Tax=Fusarium pseudocircinatum TaxID=56676 RepID=A0A8H5PXX6_9HYPO|nr:hypothetical protein FPCIR_357 [Fusarium pseudocircinatum]